MDLRSDDSGEIYVELLGRTVLLVPHTFQRMIERGITVEELVGLLESKHSKALFQRNGRIRITNGQITAVIQLWLGTAYVVTVFRK
uniref:DUF4258 domain-containing protein n=1 Tax=Fervidobacterium thailandense TaxID=1008305 RepID=A0A7C4VU62_9BACT